MTKFNLSVIVTVILMLVSPVAFAKPAPAVCLAGYLDGGLIVDATGVQQFLCTPDPAAAPAEPVTVDTHGRRDITIAQLEGMMTTFGAVRIARADLAQGSRERAAVLATLGPLWEFRPGVSTPGLLFDQATVGVPVRVTSASGEYVGQRLELASGGYLTFLFPADDECVVNDRPASPNMWSRICLADPS